MNDKHPLQAGDDSGAMVMSAGHCHVSPHGSVEERLSWPGPVSVTE